MKGRHTYICSFICVAAPRGEISTSSPLLLLASHAVSCTSFRPAKKDRSKVTFSLARRKADAQSWLALSRLQTEHSKSAAPALSPGMGNLTTVLHLQSIIQGFSKIHPVWQFQSPELHKGVSSLHSDLCVNGITHWITAAYQFPNRITMGEKKKKKLKKKCWSTAALSQKTF